eukprot:g1724.t1
MELALSAGADGAFDISGEGCNAHVTLDLATIKAEGNALLKAGDLEAAVEKYAKAVAGLGAPGGTETHSVELAAQCLANRSLALLKLGRAAEALADGEAAVRTLPTYAKAHYRVGKALAQLGRSEDAAKALLCARELDTGPSKAPNSSLVSEPCLAAKAAKNKKAKARPAATSGGFLAHGSRKGGLGLKGGSLYPEKNDVVDMSNLSSDERTQLRAMFASVMEGECSTGVACSKSNLDGLFKQMMNPRTFQQAVFPGVDDPGAQNAPVSFQQLLRCPAYHSELATLMPRVNAKARAVLDNVKRKGAAKGDIMDPDTEQFLWPQVLREAFAHEVVAMVKRVSTRQHRAWANAATDVASPHADEATWDQLELATIHAVGLQGFAFQDDFLGDEWPDLLMDDIRRLDQSGRLQSICPDMPSCAGEGGSKGETNGVARSARAGRVAWLEQTQCSDEYPALYELLQQLHALPFELNKKAGLELKAVCPGSTLLTALARGEAQAERLDCGTGDASNGFKVTCVYFFDTTWSDGDGGQLHLHSMSGEHKDVVVEPRSDRLVLFRSDSVRNAVEPVKQEHRYSITVWLHGADSMT